MSLFQTKANLKLGTQEVVIERRKRRRYRRDSATPGGDGEAEEYQVKTITSRPPVLTDVLYAREYLYTFPSDNLYY